MSSSRASSALEPGAKGMVDGGITPQTEQVFANLRAILEEAGSSLDRLVKTTVFLQNLDDFAAMNEVYKPRRRRRRLRARPSRSRSSHPERSSRSRRSPSSKEIEEYVRSLELDAYVVGGAVRDELLGVDSKDADFLVPGVDIDRPARGSVTLRTDRGARRRRAQRGCAPLPARPAIALARPGRDRAGPAAPRGLDRARPARLRDRRRPSGARRGGSRAPRLHGQRDGPPARRRLAGRPVRRPGRRRVPHAAHGLAATASRRIRCASFAACASSRSSAWSPTSRRSRRCASKLRALRSSRVSASAAGSTQTVSVSCRSCCWAAIRRQALRLARDTGVLVQVLPEFEPAIGFQQESRYHDLTVDEHTFAVVQAAADAGNSLRRTAGRALPRSRQAAGRLARDRRPAALLRAPRVLGPVARAGERRSRLAGAVEAPVPERSSLARRPDRPRTHARPGARRPRARAQVARPLRRRA